MLVYVVIVLVIVFIDLLIGVLVGFVLILLKLVLKVVWLKIVLCYIGEYEVELCLSGVVIFFKVLVLLWVFDEVKLGIILYVLMDNFSYVDYVCMELFEDWGWMVLVQGLCLVIELCVLKCCLEGCLCGSVGLGGVCNGGVVSLG